MSMLTQGTQIYVLAPTAANPATLEVLTITKATALNPGGAPAEQIEDTGLEDFDRSYLPGLRTPGQGSMTVNADPRNASHIRLYELSKMNPPPTLQFAVGWSDGTAAPTAGSGGQAGQFVLPTSRTFFTFQGYVSDFPFDFAGNSVVTTNVAIQRSGTSIWQKKTT